MLTHPLLVIASRQRRSDPSCEVLHGPVPSCDIPVLIHWVEQMLNACRDYDMNISFCDLWLVHVSALFCMEAKEKRYVVSPQELTSPTAKTEPRSGSIRVTGCHNGSVRFSSCSMVGRSINLGITSATHSKFVCRKGSGKYFSSCCSCRCSHHADRTCQGHSSVRHTQKSPAFLNPEYLPTLYSVPIQSPERNDYRHVDWALEFTERPDCRKPPWRSSTSRRRTMISSSTLSADTFARFWSPDIWFDSVWLVLSLQHCSYSWNGHGHSHGFRTPNGTICIWSFWQSHPLTFRLQPKHTHIQSFARGKFQG